MKYFYLTLSIFLFLACKNDKAKSSQHDSPDNPKDKLTTLKHQTTLGTYEYSIAEEIDTSYQKLKEFLIRMKMWVLYPSSIMPKMPNLLGLT